MSQVFCCYFFFFLSIFLSFNKVQLFVPKRKLYNIYTCIEFNAHIVRGIGHICHNTNKHILGNSTDPICIFHPRSIKPKKKNNKTLVRQIQLFSGKKKKKHKRKEQQICMNFLSYQIFNIISNSYKP